MEVSNNVSLPPVIVGYVGRVVAQWWTRFDDCGTPDINEYPLAQTEGKARYLSSAARKQREVLKAPWVMALYLEINAMVTLKIHLNGNLRNPNLSIGLWHCIVF